MKLSVVRYKSNSDWAFLLAFFFRQVVQNPQNVRRQCLKSLLDKNNVSLAEYSQNKNTSIQPR